jgi:hypothetical protein
MFNKLPKPHNASGRGFDCSEAEPKPLRLPSPDGLWQYELQIAVYRPIFCNHVTWFALCELAHSTLPISKRLCHCEYACRLLESFKWLKSNENLET